jgi:cystathionine gamma-synthase
VPIFQTSTFAQPRVGEHTGYEYARTGNPTRTALQSASPSLEGTDEAVCFASGLAAEDAVFRLLSPGDHVVMADDVYGGTWRQIAQVHARFGIEVSAVDLADLDAVRAGDAPDDPAGVGETPSNPLLKILDLAALADVAHDHGARWSPTTPSRPPTCSARLALGADLVVHSTTKYLGGHSDVVGGAVCTDAATAAELAFLQNAVGAVPGPFDAWLTLRGVKTLEVRMDRHCANAARIARSSPSTRSSRCLPGPARPPGPRARRPPDAAFGGMVSFRVAGGVGRPSGSPRHRAVLPRRVARRRREPDRAPRHHDPRLGRRHRLEVPDDLLRLSVGIETVDDLLADLRRRSTWAWTWWPSDACPRPACCRSSGRCSRGATHVDAPDVDHWHDQSSFTLASTIALPLMVDGDYMGDHTASR